VSKRLSKFELILSMVNFGPFVLIPAFASLFARTMESKSVEDPVYKKNLQRLIDRSREFEETKE
jgi:hypothetical protein